MLKCYAFIQQDAIPSAPKMGQSKVIFINSGPCDLKGSVQLVDGKVENVYVKMLDVRIMLFIL